MSTDFWFSLDPPRTLDKADFFHVPPGTLPKFQFLVFEPPPRELFLNISQPGQVARRGVLAPCVARIFFIFYERANVCYNQAEFLDGAATLKRGFGVVKMQN